MSKQYLLDFMKKYGQKCILTEPLADMTPLSFSATMDSLIYTSTEACMRLLVVNTHFPVHIP